jgi:hypothetical protein
MFSVKLKSHKENGNGLLIELMVVEKEEFKLMLTNYVRVMLLRIKSSIEIKSKHSYLTYPTF